MEMEMEMEINCANKINALKINSDSKKYITREKYISKQITIRMNKL
jgi:hypothetical protein